MSHDHLDESSFIQLVNTEGRNPTYRVNAADITTFAANATDVLTVSNPVGSNKTLRITRVQITGDANAAGTIDFYTYKRTALNTGGTSTAPAIVQYDTKDPVPTGISALYTANPTLGAGVIAAADLYVLPAAATTGYPMAPWIEDFGTRNTRSMILQPGECFSFGLNGQAIPAGLKLYAGIEWYEKPIIERLF